MSRNSTNAAVLRTIWSPILRRIRLWSHTSRERLKQRRSPPPVPRTDISTETASADFCPSANHKDGSDAKNPTSEMTKHHHDPAGESLRETSHHNNSAGAKDHDNEGCCSIDQVSKQQRRKLGQCKNQDVTITNTSCSKEVIDTTAKAAGRDKLHSKGTV